MAIEFSWTDVEEIAIQLAEAHPDVDPMAVPFPRLRHLVEQLPGFTPKFHQSVNEKILEAIQMNWIEEKKG